MSRIIWKSNTVTLEEALEATTTEPSIWHILEYSPELGWCPIEATERSVAYTVAQHEASKGHTTHVAINGKIAATYYPI